MSTSTQAVLGRQRDGFAKAELEGFDQAGFGGAALGLVAHQVHRLARLAQDLGKALVERNHAGTGIDHEQDDVGFANGQLGLLAHAVFKTAVGDILITGRIEDAEGQVGNATLGFAPIASDTGRVIDKRDLAADEAVEQRGLANIGTTDNGDGDGHGHQFRSGGRQHSRY